MLKLVPLDADPNNSVSSITLEILPVSRNDSITPFLFRFARPCLSPERYVKPTGSYYYDHDSSLVRWRNGIDNPPAVIASGDEAPQTKKCDMEKGEDSKDRWMWR